MGVRGVGVRGVSSTRMRRPPPLPFVAAGVAGVVLHGFVAPLEQSLSSMVRGLLQLASFVSAGVLGFTSFRALDRGRAAGRIATTGPYRFTRNPSYVAFFLFQVTFGLQWNNAWIVLLAPVAFVISHFWIVLPEERELAERFGAEYESYKRSVRRYL